MSRCYPIPCSICSIHRVKYSHNLGNVTIPCSECLTLVSDNCVLTFEKVCGSIYTTTQSIEIFASADCIDMSRDTSPLTINLIHSTHMLISLENTLTEFEEHFDCFHLDIVKSKCSKCILIPIASYISADYLVVSTELSSELCSTLGKLH